MVSVTELTAGPGAAVLATAMTMPDGRTDPLRAAAALAHRCPDVPPDLRALALTQVELRRRASGRFGDDAARMFFTRDGLEQSTRPAVAAHRASSLHRRAGAPVRTALDLCCGIGGDLVALARSGFEVTGADRDPEALAVAAANLRALGLAGSLLDADVTTVDPSSADVVVADPARRGPAGRVHDPERFSPPWSWVLGLLARPDIRACVTTTPALAHRDVPAGCEAEWVDHDGSTVELAVWSPVLSGREVRRRATLLGADGSIGATVTDRDSGADQPVAVEDPRPGQWLLEPRGAVIRAGLVGVVAALVGGTLPGPGIAYVVTDDPASAAELGAAFEISEVLPLRRAVLRRRLRELGAGSVEILARGVQVDVPALRSEVLTRGAGDAAVTLVLTRTRAGAVALLTTREPDAQP